MAIEIKPRSNKQGLVDSTADLAAIEGRSNYTVLVKDYGVFEWLSSGTANSVDIFAGKTGVWSLVTSSAPAGNVAVKTYRALVTQATTAAPTAAVLENSLGGTLVWARGSAGTYTATLTGAFTSDKTFIMQPGETGTIAAIKNVIAVRTSDNVVTVTTGAGGTLEDSVLSSFPIEILVYP
jgi:hypothetical protein